MVDMGSNGTNLSDDIIFQITVTLAENRTLLVVTGNDGINEPWVETQTFPNIDLGLTPEATEWLEGTLIDATQNMLDFA